MCARCHGTAHELADAPRPLRTGRGVWPLDLARGGLALFRCTGQVLLHRAFVGQLRLPIATNLIAAATLAAAAAIAYGPLYDAFAGPWPILDGWRATQRERGPVLLLLTSVWLTWPVWFEIVTGAATEPLVAAADRAIGGPGMTASGAPSAAVFAQRVHRRARLLATQLMLMPLLWLVALLPWIGPPTVFVATAALAALVWLEQPAERRGLDRASHHADLRHNWARALGYGAAAQIAILVPLLNVLVLAAGAAVAAALLQFQFDKRAAPPGAA